MGKNLLVIYTALYWTGLRWLVLVRTGAPSVKFSQRFHFIFDICSFLHCIFVLRSVFANPCTWHCLVINCAHLGIKHLLILWKNLHRVSNLLIIWHKYGIIWCILNFYVYWHYLNLTEVVNNFLIKFMILARCSTTLQHTPLSLLPPFLGHCVAYIFICNKMFLLCVFTIYIVCFYCELKYIYSNGSGYGLSYIINF